MVQLIDSDIRTREVLAWQGLKIFHARMSSCSQKLRIFLNLKGIEWQGHELDLAGGDTYTDWFMGINPRGLVPVVVWDGAVYIESNDILAMLEERFPEPCLIPPERASEVASLLEQEDDLHLDLRTLSFRFVLGRTGTNKTPEQLAQYKEYPATVSGVPDHDKRAREFEFYERLAVEGLSDRAVRAAAAKFREAFDALDSRLSRTPHYFGDSVSVMDIAWFVYASRLHLGGYPFDRLHPHIHRWRETLARNDKFAREVAPPPPLMETIVRNQAEWGRNGTTLADIVGF